MAENSRIEWTNHTFNPGLDAKRCRRDAIIAMRRQ